MNTPIAASDTQIWLVIAAIGAGTYIIRLSFLGIIGGRQLPSWLLRLLRFTPVAVLPGIAMPMVIGANIEALDPVRLVAAFATVGIGLITRNALYAILTGFVIFFGLNAVLA